MAKVLLVNPALAYGTWNADLKKPSPDNIFIRLGLAYLAGALNARGHEVVLADLRAMTGWSHYEEMVRKVSPDFIGISMHSVEFSYAVEAGQRAKKIFPHVMVVAGGIHPTMFPDECLDTGAFDFVLQGEGEISFPLLVEDPSKFPEKFWGEVPDLNEIPFPDREIWTDFHERMYAEPFGMSRFSVPMPMAEIINIRGCPYNCSFCCGPGEHQLYTKTTGNGKRIPYIRGRSVSNVVDEVEMLISKFGIKSAMFHDDQFIMLPKWVDEFCDELHKRGIAESGFKWITSSRADIICRNDELIGKMADAGLLLLIVGFESFSPRILEWFNKGITSEQNSKAAEICHKHNVKIWANYILGIPTDTGWHQEDDLMTVEGVLRADPVHFSPAFYTPVPGSKLYDFYKNNCLIIGDEDNERLSNRGAMDAKVKGVDYDFLKALMITDAIFS
ncbi:MAG: B12-binding domain-containing radical SAM protein [Nitrospiraceae bacterium]|nr:MAG: B12-binding domain-containing radical SAM protein [Nitrospiraceae bacterium]